MPYPLPLTRTEAYLAYKAGVIQQSDLKPSLAIPRNGIDAWLAYWTGLAADYPKREDGTPHILQEEEAYIAYLCGVINTYPEKCLRRVGAYLRYLISARWGRPDHPLNREELYLSLIKTQFIPSGDPSSDIVIDGTAKAPFVDVKMYGDTYQQSYTGQNLYNVATLPTSTYVTKDGDGWITITRDNTSGDSTVYTNVWTSNLALETSTQYRIFIEVKAVSGTGSLFITSTNSTQGQFNSWQEKKLANMVAGQTYTVAPTTKSSFSGISQGLRTVLEQTAGQGGSVTFRLSVCASSTPTDTFSYEPYVGGTTSPNPEYPQPIQTVTGLQTVEVSGKNLLSSVWEPGSYSTITGGKQDVANTYRTAEKVAVQSDTTYIVSRDSAGLAMNYYEYDANGNFLAYTLKSANQSITTGQTTKFITMSRSQTGGFEKMMLESGSTVTAYEPYSSNAYEINLGKNLFDKSSVTLGKRIGQSGTLYDSEDGFTSDFISANENTAYIVNYTVTSYRQRIYFYDSSKTGISYVENSSSFTTPANTMYIRICAAQTILDSAQLELGSTATPYAPYFTPIELCKIGTYQDYIYKNNGEWKIRSRIVKTKLVSNLSGWSISSFDTQKRLYIPSQNAFGAQVVYYSTNNDPAPQLCSHFMNISATALLGGETGISISSSGYLSIRDNNQESAQGFKDWIDENEPVAYAVRAIPTDIPITNSALIAQLDALLNGGAEDGTTYIKVNTADPNLPGLLYVEAPKYE